MFYMQNSRMLKQMTAKHLKRFIAVTLVTASLAISLFAFGCVGSSAARVRREHGLQLPSSATGFVCRGDAWKHTFIDSGAVAAFEMASSDLPNFISQLRIHDTQETTLPDGYQIHRPWMKGTPLKAYRCESPTGDELDVHVWAIDDAHVGVLLYTDWN